LLIIQFLMKKKSSFSILKAKLFFVGFFIFVSLLLHFKSYNQNPSRTHAWAQSDHYAIALGFLDNNFDFFHPQTYTLNHQFPAQEPVKNPTGITSIDFPILHYVAAISMKVLATDSPWVFRLVSLLWSFIALYFLFITLVRIKGFWEALSVVSFILLIPTYSYYQNGFLPSMAAFNSLLIGSSFLIRFYFSSKNSDLINNYSRFESKSTFYFGLTFIVLAALMRFTHVIFLLGLTGVYFLAIFKEKKVSLKFLMSVLGLGIVGLYFLYNSYLAKTYGSVFLNKPVIANSLSEFIQHLLHQLKTYTRETFTLFHITIVVVLFVLLRKQNSTNLFKNNTWKLWIIISTIGVLLFNFLMTYHMAVHDYYALDTWIPILSLIIIYLFLQLDFSNYKPISFVIAVLITTGLLSLGAEKQFTKYKHNYGMNDQIISDFNTSSAFLDSHTVDKQKILIICSPGWNAPMIGWKKQVYRIAWNFSEQIPIALNEDYDVIITHNASDLETINHSPSFHDSVEKIADNSLVTIWKLK